MRDATGDTRHCGILCAASSGQRDTSSMRVELYSTTSAQHGTDATQDATHDRCRSMHQTQTEPTTRSRQCNYEMRAEINGSRTLARLDAASGSLRRPCWSGGWIIGVRGVPRSRLPFLSTRAQSSAQPRGARAPGSRSSRLVRFNACCVVPVPRVFAACCGTGRMSHLVRRRCRVAHWLSSTMLGACCCLSAALRQRCVFTVASRMCSRPLACRVLSVARCLLQA